METSYPLRQFISLPESQGKDNNQGIHIASLIEPLQQVRQFLQIGERSVPVKQANHSLSGDTQLASNQFAAYVWNSDQLIAQPGLWSKKQTSAVNRFLLSLNAQQISRIASNPDGLNKFLQDARQNGKKVELLLGDPDWILPEHRGDLLQIVSKLVKASFDGLHLDIEPDQLESGLTGKTGWKN